MLDLFLAFWTLFFLAPEFRCPLRARGGFEGPVDLESEASVLPLWFLPGLPRFVLRGSCSVVPAVDAEADEVIDWGRNIPGRTTKSFRGLINPFISSCIFDMTLNFCLLMFSESQWRKFSLSTSFPSEPWNWTDKTEWPILVYNR